MPVPKKRQGHQRQATRRAANWKPTIPAVAYCPNCSSPKHPHTVCGVCGFYKDKVVSLRVAKRGGADE